MTKRTPTHSSVLLVGVGLSRGDGLGILAVTDVPEYMEARARLLPLAQQYVHRCP